MEVFTRLKLNQKEQSSIIFENLSKMLSRRNILNSKSSKEFIDSLNQKYNKNGIYTIKINDYNFTIIIYFKKLSGIKKNSDIENTLIKTKADFKFLITENFTNKTLSQSKEFNTELFKTIELLCDIPSNPLIPTHKLLTLEEKQKFISIYNEKNLARIHSSDVMARHLNAKPNDIIKIIRPTINSGHSIYYRRVVNL